MYIKELTIARSKDLLEKAFKRARKIQISERDKRYRTKKTIIARTDAFATTVISFLEKIIKGFPSLDKLPLFYQELIDIKIDVNKLKKSLGAIDWARKTCKMIYSKQAKSLKKSNNLVFLKQKQHEIYGRMSSIIKQVDTNLDLLMEAQGILRGFPDIRDIPTIVIAGYPNVGKSSLVKRLSSAKPRVEKYPFTTLDVHVGHIEKKNNHVTHRYQIIDTPGLLDRPLSKRNKIEQQAIAALNYLADIIVFILDPSETCGYYLVDQKQLLTQLQELFSGYPIIIVENKADVVKKKSSTSLKISCETGEGIDVLLNEIFQVLNREDIKEKKE